MNRVILPANNVSGRNILVQSMFPSTNTIYEITMDYDLDGATITMPANCSLHFIGGSFKNTKTTVAHVIGSHTSFESDVDNIIGKNVNLDGTFRFKSILANWFIGSNLQTDTYTTDDADMFNRAFENALRIHGQLKRDNSSLTLLVTCRNDVYEIMNPISIGVGVSFDGNGCQFKPNSNMAGKFMFVANAVSSGSGFSQTLEYPGNILDTFGNFSVINSSPSVLCHMLYCADSRHIHNIKLFNPAKIIEWDPHYLDLKRCSDIKGYCVNIFPPTTSTNLNDLKQNAHFIIGLGDNAVIKNISDGLRFYVSNGAHVSFDHCLNCQFTFNECSCVSLSDLHNESGLIRLFTSSIKITNSYFYAKDGGNFILTGSYNKYSELQLNNVIFDNLKNINYNSYNICNTDGNSRLVAENVYGRLWNNNSQGHHGGTAFMLKHINNYINPNRFIQSGLEVLEDYLHIGKLNGNIVLPTFTEGAETYTATSYYRVMLIVDPVRNIRLIQGNITQYRSISSKKSINVNFANNSNNGVELLSGCILRIEMGSSSSSYSHYFDYGMVYKGLDTIKVIKDGSSYKVAFYSAKSINYGSYIDCNYYERHGSNVKVWLATNIVPSASSFKDTDEIYLPNGNSYRLISGQWV